MIIFIENDNFLKVYMQKHAKLPEIHGFVIKNLVF